MRVTVSLMFSLHFEYVDPCKHESSMYAELMCPFDLKLANTGFNILVKTRGEWVKPMISAVNWYF